MNDQIIALLNKVFKLAPKVLKEIGTNVNGNKIYFASYQDFDLHILAGVTPAECQLYQDLNNVFLKFKIPVAKLFGSDSKSILVFEHLGSENLLDLILSKKLAKSEILNLYKQILDWLVVMQVDLTSKLKTTTKFSAELIYADLKYFNEFYLKDKNQATDLEFKEFAKELSSFKGEYFYYRDLMPRNILVKNKKIYFIDYLGDRNLQGILTAPLAASPAILINHSRANLANNDREHLLNYYLDLVSKRFKIDQAGFLDCYWSFSLLKALQNLGTYGSLGVKRGERKFIDNLPNYLREVSFAFEHAPKWIKRFSFITASC